MPVENSGPSAPRVYLFRGGGSCWTGWGGSSAPGRMAAWVGDVVALAVLLGAVAEAAPAIAACGSAATAKNKTSSAGQHRPAAVSAASSQPLVIRATPVIRAPGKAQS
jgi:hypothetical protein